MVDVSTDPHCREGEAAGLERQDLALARGGDETAREAEIQVPDPFSTDTLAAGPV